MEYARRRPPYKKPPVEDDPYTNRPADEDDNDSSLFGTVIDLANSLEHPENPAETVRVLTIMLAEEY